MKLRSLLALATLAAGCGGYINNGPPPRLAIDHPLRVEIAVTGAERDTVQQALKWVLGATHQVAWVKSGGDARLLFKSALTEDREMLGGTECTLRVELSAARDGADLLTFTHAFKSNPATSNLPIEKEKLITRGVVWALEEASARLAAPRLPSSRRQSPQHLPPSTPRPPSSIRRSRHPRRRPPPQAPPSPALTTDRGRSGCGGWRRAERRHRR